MSDRKAVIKNADMNDEMQQEAVDCAQQALDRFNIEKVRFVLISIDFPSQIRFFFVRFVFVVFSGALII